MKPIHVIMAAAGGLLVGAAVGMLFAPDKGSNTRKHIADYMRSKGIPLKKNNVEKLADEIAAELNSK